MSQGVLRRRSRFAASVLSLVALLLWAVIPQGVMPVANGAGGASFVLCTGDGPLAVTLGADGELHPVAPGQRAPDDRTCAFAAAPAATAAAHPLLAALVAEPAPAAARPASWVLPEAAERHLRPESRAPPLNS